MNLFTTRQERRRKAAIRSHIQTSKGILQDASARIQALEIQVAVAHHTLAELTRAVETAPHASNPRLQSAMNQAARVLGGKR